VNIAPFMPSPAEAGWQKKREQSKGAGHLSTE
jgi:hypothetical protein